MSEQSALQVVEIATAATLAYRREDLSEQLAQTRARLLDPAIRVVVAGEFKQGKSELINALLNAPICPVDDDIATSVPTVVRYAERPVGRVVSDGDAELPAELDLDRIIDYVSEAGNPGNHKRVDHVEIGLPREVLSGGLVLIDTPGVGGLNSAHGAATMTTLTSADAVLLVSDAAQEYTATELAFLRDAARVCPNLVCVLTKIDLYPSWRLIAEANMAQLAAAGIQADVLAVSSTLRLHAVRERDQALNAESGFPRLVSYLRERIVAEADQLSRRSTAQDVLGVVQQLCTGLDAELAALQAPDRAGTLISELQTATGRADQLRERSARWQQTLNDGIADLISDVEYDLRDRMRAIVAEAEEELSAADPALIGEPFSQWLNQRVAAAASTNFIWAHERSHWLAGRVAEHFAEDGRKLLPPLTVKEAPSLAMLTDGFEIPETEKFSVGQKVIVGMRGAYGGTLMIGLLSTVGGLALLNPFSIAAGVLLGTKTVRDEHKRLRLLRQNQAKTAVRRFIDDVVFHLGKDSRDLLRETQRVLRDHFTVQADNLTRSLAEAVRAAQQALQTGESERAKRIQDIRAELERVGALEEVARQLVLPVQRATPVLGGVMHDARA
ncbi:Isoniazid-inducible protein iniA [Pseudonocardiaceae bacterium YIM PH 21723]|nr:Isoniazid-inducible protein iniA [Pseudonocardiaceae bacterium YIM PH 21723]